MTRSIQFGSRIILFQLDFSVAMGENGNAARHVVQNGAEILALRLQYRLPTDIVVHIIIGRKETLRQEFP